MPGKCVRGAVVEVNLDPVVGSEANKTRPCVVIQNDVGNRFSPIVIIAAITGARTSQGNIRSTFPFKKAKADWSRTASCSATRLGPSMRNGW